MTRRQSESRRRSRVSTLGYGFRTGQDFRCLSRLFSLAVGRRKFLLARFLLLAPKTPVEFHNSRITWIATNRCERFKKTTAIRLIPILEAFLTIYTSVPKLLA